MIEVAWPQSDGALLAWSHLLLAWVVALYYLPPTWSAWTRLVIPSAREGSAGSWFGHAIPKALLLVVVPVLILGRRPGAAIAVAALGAALALVLSWARERGSERWKMRGAELELGTTAAYVALSALVIADTAVRPRIPLLVLPLTEGRIAAITFCAAITLFVGRGGTQVVRAILTKAGSLPISRESRPAEDAEGRRGNAVDTAEYNRGRLIGVIERLLLAWLVAAGSYAAMGFVIAAKGLIRSKDLESRDFAEYFLVGTLASTAVALVAGGLLRMVLLGLW